MTRKFPERPAHPERICWGCDRYCPAAALACGNGSERSPHPAELFGEDWLAWSPAAVLPSGGSTPDGGQAPQRTSEIRR
ncbi:DUF3079 domain-containing protein [Paracidovorax cattleyae]|uniref:DUF3079 domain-containing protein n=1 Tax=Paracidovorax cattleyae TaxID=80868 RepID=A0A1H0NNF2_9BURK|nr:DUF3079 domain-containing protein [Paracidovorax cattleyae]AVS75038.1 DUF3079 domain-containing protein [Paracidovorax cattleyae]SDO94213.1 Protein of unknown function [Paracidovorax cattleyae]